MSELPRDGREDLPSPHGRWDPARALRRGAPARRRQEDSRTDGAHPGAPGRDGRLARDALLPDPRSGDGRNPRALPGTRPAQWRRRLPRVPASPARLKTEALFRDARKVAVLAPTGAPP